MQGRVLVPVGVLAAVAVGFPVISGTGAQAPSPPTGTLELVQRGTEGTFKFVDIPPRNTPERPAPGDIAILGGPVRDSSGQRVGKVHAVLMRLEGRRRPVDQASTTFALQGGDILAVGLARNARIAEQAIIGGTGRYAGARGTLRIMSTRTGPRFVFTFM